LNLKWSKFNLNSVCVCLPKFARPRLGSVVNSEEEPASPGHIALGMVPDEEVSREKERVANVFNNPSTSGLACVIAAHVSYSTFLVPFYTFSSSHSAKYCLVFFFQNLVKEYPVKLDGKSDQNATVKKRVVNGVSFLMEEGEVFGLLGHNGAGKTTVMKIITTEERPDKGNVSV